MKAYLDMGREILARGNRRGDRTGTGTISLFGPQMEFDISDNKLPLVTTKKVHTKSIIHELLWILAGSTNNNDLTNQGVHIWDEWAIENGELGPVYGAQWRRWKTNQMTQRELTLRERLEEVQRRDSTLGDILLLALECAGDDPEKLNYLASEAAIHGVGPTIAVPLTIDQISELMKGLKAKPFSRRHCVSAWNPTDLPDESVAPRENVSQGRMALASCHAFFQLYVAELNIDERAIAGLARGWDGCCPDGQGWLVYAFDETEMPAEAKETFMRYFDEKDYPKYKLSCKLYQRSADFCLGVPFNITSYAILTMMMAQCLNMLPDRFIHTFGDAHIYSNHIDTFRDVQLPREPFALPRLVINPDVKDIFGFKYEDFGIQGYRSHPGIVYDVST